MHLLCWVLPQQVAKYGNLWRFSTIAIESRGGRLKRIGSRVVGWRPYQEGTSVYEYIDYRTGKEVRREQSYRSSPMEQLLLKICAQERAWHATRAFVRPAKMRLQRELRRRRVKVEVTDDHAGEDGAESDCVDMADALLGARNGS